MTSIVKILMTTAALAAPTTSLAAQAVTATQCTTSDVRQFPTISTTSTVGTSSKIGPSDVKAKPSNGNSECARNFQPLDIAAVVQLPEASEEGEQPAELGSAYYITCQ